jgi:hypothetical protein
MEWTPGPTPSPFREARANQQRHDAHLLCQASGSLNLSRPSQTNPCIDLSERQKTEMATKGDQSAHAHWRGWEP